MNIYSFPTFNLTKVLFTAEELGMPYQLHLMKIGEHRKPEHLTRHPMGKVPAVEINGQFYFESNSICRLMAELNGNKLYANTPEERAHINEWVDFLGHHIGRWLSTYFVEEVVNPGLLKKPTNASALEEAAVQSKQQLPALEKVLGEHEFIVGKQITIADTIGFSLFSVKEITSVNLDAYPNVQRWYQMMKARPAYARAMKQIPNGNMFAAFGK